MIYHLPSCAFLPHIGSILVSDPNLAQYSQVDKALKILGAKVHRAKPDRDDDESEEFYLGLICEAAVLDTLQQDNIVKLQLWGRSLAGAVLLQI